MKILVVTQNKKRNVTGGHFINQRIYDLLNDNISEVCFTSDLMNCEKNLSFLFNLLLNVRKFNRFNAILLDSSLFPKAFLFVCIFSLLYGSKKLIVIHHHFCSFMIDSVKGFVYRFLEKKFLNKAGVIVVFSPYIERLTRQYCPSVEIRHVGLPFNRDVVQGEKNRKKLLFVGTIEERKGLIYLIRAIGLLPSNVKEDLMLNIVGKTVSEKYYDSLKGEIIDLGLEKNISFLGRVDDVTLKKIYSESGIFVFPSMLEGFGMVVIDAMMNSIPVIVFNNSSMPFIVEHECNGILVENKNVEEYAEAISRLILDDVLYEKLSKGAFLKAKSMPSFTDFDNNVLNEIRTYMCKLSGKIIN